MPEYKARKKHYRPLIFSIISPYIVWKQHIHRYSNMIHLAQDVANSFSVRFFKDSQSNNLLYIKATYVDVYGFGMLFSNATKRVIHDQNYLEVCPFFSILRKTNVICNISSIIRSELKYSQKIYHCQRRCYLLSGLISVRVAGQLARGGFFGFFSGLLLQNMIPKQLYEGQIWDFDLLPYTMLLTSTTCYPRQHCRFGLHPILQDKQEPLIDSDQVARIEQCHQLGPWKMSHNETGDLIVQTMTKNVTKIPVWRNSSIHQRS